MSFFIIFFWFSYSRHFISIGCTPTNCQHFTKIFSHFLIDTANLIVFSQQITARVFTHDFSQACIKYFKYLIVYSINLQNLYKINSQIMHVIFLPDWQSNSKLLLCGQFYQFQYLLSTYHE